MKNRASYGSDLSLQLKTKAPFAALLHLQTGMWLVLGPAHLETGMWLVLGAAHLETEMWIVLSAAESS